LPKKIRFYLILGAKKHKNQLILSIISFCSKKAYIFANLKVMNEKSK